MLFRVDHGSATSLADQIAIQVRSGISIEQLSTGERLPPARDLATSLRVNMHTVLRAYQQLRDEGLIELRPGRGAIVAHNAGADMIRITDLTTQLVTEARKIGLPAAELHARIDQMMGNPS